MVVEATLIVDDDKGGQNESLVLTRLVVLLLEKTQNLEQIQATYDRDLDTLRERVNDQESTIKLLSEDVGNLSARVTTPIKLGPSSLKTSVPDSARASSQTSEDPTSPGLSSSLQDVFNHLEFLNDKSIKLESISSLSDGKHSPSLQLHEESLNREQSEETLRKPTPILVTTLSYDTSTYNDSMNTSDSGGEEIEEVCAEEEIEEICAEEDNVSSLQCSAPDPTNIVEKRAPTTMKSLKKKTVVSQIMITKIPIVLQDASCDEDETHDSENIKQEEEEDTFDERSLQSNQDMSTSLPADESESEVDDFKLQFPWRRSNTFDVIPVSQTSVIAVPVKPKRGIVSPLQTQRHPTERNDTLGDMSQLSYSEKAPLQALANESTEPSDHSTFSQVSSNRSSSFDYEVQYIMPQHSEDDSHQPAEDENKTGAAPINFSFDATDVSSKVISASTSDIEDDAITPQ